MKKNLCSLMVIAILLITTVGCKKHETTPEPAPRPAIITISPLPTTVLSAGDQTIAKISIVASQTFTWYQLSFNYTSQNVTLANAKLVDENNNVAAECWAGECWTGGISCTSLIGTTVAAGETKVYSLKVEAIVGAGSAFVTTQAQFLTVNEEYEYNLSSLKPQTMGK